MNELERKYFEELYGLYAATIYRVAYSYMGNRPEAEDAAADTFLRMMRTGAHFENAEHEKAWLIRVCINVCKNRKKEYWKRNVIGLTEDIPFGQSETGSEIAELLADLPVKQRMTVYLHYYEGYSVSEIASFFRMTNSGVKTQLHRARLALKDLLD